MKLLFGSIFLLVLGIIYLIFGIVYLRKESTVVIIVYFTLTAFTISLSLFGVISSTHAEYVKRYNRNRLVMEEPQGLLDEESANLNDKTPEEMYFGYLEENTSNL